MTDDEPRRPTSLRKLLAWAIRGGLSVFFAEISLGSYPFAFFDAWGLLVVRTGSVSTARYVLFQMAEVAIPRACSRRSLSESGGYECLKRCRDDAGRSRDRSRFTGVAERVCLHASRKPD